MIAFRPVIEQELYKVCPECAGEYRPDVERCHDCGVALVHPEEIAARDARELRASPGLVALRTAPIDWARALAADLDRGGIRYRVDRRQARREGLLTVYVRRQDREAAAATDAARERIEEPSGGETAAAAGPAHAAPDYKVCPRCGGEYRLEIERCVDCGIELVFPGEEGTGEGEAEAAEEWVEEDPAAALPYTGPLHELPPSDDLVCICCAHAGPLQALSQELDEAGIAHRLEPAPFGMSEVGCLYVLQRDGDAAAAIDAGQGRVPLDDPELQAELSTCPVCGAAHSLEARECPGCGLGLSGPILEAACSRCGAVVRVAAASCPNCAAALAES